jgi:cellulose synthase operon protein C
MLAALLVPLLFAMVTPDAQGQDFDPRGRGRPRPPGPGRPPVRPGPGPARPGPGPARPPVGPTAQPGPAAPANPPAGVPASVLIERYARIVLAQPGSPFPLQRLAQLYRDRDGKTDALVKDFETRAAQAGADQYSATVALAGIYKIEGRADEAVHTYERGIAMKPSEAGAVMALARLLQDRADLVGARQRYEQALALQTSPTEKQQTLRTLMTVALDAKDWDGAQGYHNRLVTLDRTSLFTKGELGRELFSRGEYARAEGEFQALVAAAPCACAGAQRLGPRASQSRQVR